MNADLLLKEFHRISEAADAVPRLRRLILDLAIRGLLVSQDSSDEPATELLRRIAVAKSNLNGRNSQEKVPPFSGDAPFEIPATWAWTQLEAIGIINPKNDADDSQETSFVPMQMIYAEYGATNGHEIRPWREIKKGFTHFAEGDVGLAKITPCFENGKSTVFRGLTGGIGAGTTELLVIRPLMVSADYILIFLKSEKFMQDGIPKMTGTAGQKRVPRDYFAYSPFPLPPLAEQTRVVAKVQELMGLCDELEQARDTREKRRAKLLTASLERLSSAASSTDDSGSSFQENARFYFNHLPRLTTRPEHIHQLRQAILDLAVRGRLVKQDPKDEPASALKWEISSQKARQTDLGNLKSDKKFWEGIQDQPPYKIPANWVWTRLQDVFEISRGGSPRPAGDPRYFGGTIPWITVGEVTKDAGKFLTSTTDTLTEEGSEKSRFVEPGDLLLTNSGATLGVPKISKIRGCINDGVAVLRLFHSFDINEFAYEFLRAQTHVFRKVNQGMGQPNLNTPIIAAWHFPLPPLLEQKRIVAKISQLMALCDELECQLRSTASVSRALLEALLQQALASSEVPPKSALAASPFDSLRR